MSSANPWLLRVRQIPQALAQSLPILSRELTEQAARRRTFVLRAVYAVALYGFAFWILWALVSQSSGQRFGQLGRGRELFEGLSWLQFGGLYLFLPAMASGVVTIEKERDTLSLLLLTKLGPWSIVLGKLFSRLLPMATFLSLSLPLVAVAYGLGGVNESDILALAWTLSVTSLQIGALAVACSSWFRTTAGAFIGTYLTGAVLIGGPIFLTQSGMEIFSGPVDFLREYLQVMGLSGQNAFMTEEVGLILFGPWVCLHPNGLNQPFEVTVLRTVPMLIFAGTCVVFARAVLWRRAFLKSSNLIIRIFRSLDKMFHQLNQNRWTKGIVLTREQVDLPDYSPIRWRETTKRSLGTTRYLVRLLLILEIPILCGMLIPFHGDFTSPYTPVYICGYFLWVVVALVLGIQATGLVGAERSRQTLDVLLATPMASETIAREKLAGVWRMVRVLWIPFATIYLFQCWWRLSVLHRDSIHVAFALVRGMLATLIYLPLIVWFGFHLGLRYKSQAVAILVCLGAMATVCLVPILLSWPFDQSEWQLFQQTKWVSPVQILSVSTEHSYEYDFYTYGGLQESISFTVVCVLAHFTVATLLMLWFRYLTLKSFACYVQRNDGQVVDDDDLDRLARVRERMVAQRIFRRHPDEE